jgi:hypothetical protein
MNAHALAHAHMLGPTQATNAHTIQTKPRRRARACAHICARAGRGFGVANARHAGQVRARLVAAALHPSCASKDSCIECLNNVGAFGPPALAGAVSLILAESAVCLQPLQLLTVFAHAVGAVGVLYSSNLPDTLQCRSAHLCPDIRGCAVHVRYIAHIAPSRGGCTVCSACVQTGECRRLIRHSWAAPAGAIAHPALQCVPKVRPGLRPKGHVVPTRPCLGKRSSMERKARRPDASYARAIAWACVNAHANTLLAVHRWVMWSVPSQYGCDRAMSA